MKKRGPIQDSLHAFQPASSVRTDQQFLAVGRAVDAGAVAEDADRADRVALVDADDGRAAVGAALHGLVAAGPVVDGEACFRTVGGGRAVGGEELAGFLAAPRGFDRGGRARGGAGGKGGSHQSGGKDANAHGKGSCGLKSGSIGDVSLSRFCGACLCA